VASSTTVRTALISLGDSCVAVVISKRSLMRQR
jgi:hypothetical protein